ncbi:MAG: undecaprenyldiphospho-muramoylpentapeptide beta-N-acetylglucosaminyltransferase [Abditibacteriota bacterium]|nr:undecaprenyldiphospho-muramoylpentapeptide beta-N-acetylglucosaminyltransferase [Abditibacteriota bacterium]
MNIVITGGGTGGHVYPAVAVAEYIRKRVPQAQLLYIGTEKGPEAAAAQEAGIDFEAVPACPLNQLLSPRCIGALRDLVGGINLAGRLLDRFGADLVFGTGGYVCSPVYVAAKKRRLPIVVHEQNSVPGKANLQVSGYASCVCITFPEAAKGFPSGKTVLTGLPVREEFFRLPSREEAAEALGIGRGMFTVLACGGSQGAESINRAVVDMVKKGLAKDIYVIHQTGAKKLQGVLDDMADYRGGNYKAFGFLDMPQAFACADLVIGRAGASTTCELQAAGIPAVLIPYPYAAGDHQYHNAIAYRNAGGCQVIRDSELSAELLCEQIKKLRSGNVLDRMREGAAAAAVPNAAENITKIILDVLT